MLFGCPSGQSSIGLSRMSLATWRQVTFCDTDPCTGAISSQSLLACYSRAGEMGRLSAAQPWDGLTTAKPQPRRARRVLT